MTSAGPNSRCLAHKYGIRSVRIDWDDSRTLHIFQPSTTARAQRQSTPEQPAAGQQAKQHSHRFMQKFRARTRSIHKAAHPKQCTVLYRANGCRGMRAAESGSGEESRESGDGAHCLAMPRAVQCAPLPQLPLVAQMPRRMVPSGDAKHSMRARALRTLAPRLLHCPPPRRSTACR